MPDLQADEEWIEAIEAAKLLAPRLGGLTRAQLALAIGLREGILSAAAEETYIAEGDEAEPTDEVAAPDELIGIPNEVWAQSAIWDSDRLSWDWDIGGFDVYTDDSSYSFIGVHFLRFDVDNIDPSKPPYVDISPGDVARAQADRKQRSAAGKYWDWEPAFAKLIALADLDGLEPEFGPPRRGFSAKLEQWFAETMRDSEGHEPSVNECRLRARSVIKAIERLRAERVNS